MSTVSRHLLPGMLILLGGCSVSFHASSDTGGGPEAAARTFLQRVATDGAAAAYATAAPQMYRTVGPDAFHAMALSFGLDRYQSVDFTDSTPSGDGTTLLGGTLYERGSLAEPIKVRLIANQGAWQVVALDLTQIGVNRVGEGAADPGIAIGTKVVTATALAADCSRIAQVRTLVCARSIPFRNGAASECAGARSDRMVAVNATLTDVDQTAGTMNVECRVSN